MATCCYDLKSSEERWISQIYPLELSHLLLCCHTSSDKSQMHILIFLQIPVPRLTHPCKNGSASWSAHACRIRLMNSWPTGLAHWNLSSPTFYNPLTIQNFRMPSKVLAWHQMFFYSNCLALYIVFTMTSCKMQLLCPRYMILSARVFVIDIQLWTKITWNVIVLQIMLLCQYFKL